MTSGERRLTAKGEATRARIIESAADLILARGVGATSLEEVRLSTATSKSQLFHYFPGGKAEMVSAIAAFQAARVLDAQRPHLDRLDSFEEWEAWAGAVVAHYGSQPHWGCPIGAMSAEAAGQDPALAAQLLELMREWIGHLQAGVARMVGAGLLREETDPRQMATAIFAALQGGLLLTQAMRSIEPLQDALDGALAALRATAG